MGKLVLLGLLLIPAIALARPEPDPALTYAIPVDGYPGDGPADAKVTMVVAHDYADPYSHRNRATLDELRKKYGNDLRIVFRNMVVHPRVAMAGALASCAAHKQRKFELLEDKLWDAFARRQWDTSEVDQGNGLQKCWDLPEGCAIVVAAAKEIGLDVARFKADMQTCVAQVEDDMRELQTFAVAATPTFFINGRYLAGAQPTATYETLIDEELLKANAAIRKGTPKSRYYKQIVLGNGEPRVDPNARSPQAAPPVPVAPRPTRPAPDPALTYAIKVDGSPSRGRADALVTIVMFFDYSTPYAERARATLDELAQRYGNDVRFVYRTRLIHPHNATASALALCAAHKAGGALEMDAALWEKGFKARNLDASEVDLGNGPQKCWDTADGCKAVIAIAQDLGHDLKRFKADMVKCAKTVTDDDADAIRFAVNATPTFFINGRMLQGAQPAGSFATIIDDELAKARTRIKQGTPKARYYRTWILGKGLTSVP